MFSGIVATQARALDIKSEHGLLRLVLQRPASFSDIKIGDSICVDGVCLTIESFTDDSMAFAIGAETLKVTRWNPSILSHCFNVEQSLRWGDRVHGHMVSGHVDGLAMLKEREEDAGSLLLAFEVPEQLCCFLWKKGSCSINGVSLTINEVKERKLHVCLIPETRKITNLENLKVGETVNLEVDMLARGLQHAIDARLSAINQESL